MDKIRKSIKLNDLESGDACSKTMFILIIIFVMCFDGSEQNNFSLLYPSQKYSGLASYEFQIDGVSEFRTRDPNLSRPREHILYPLVDTLRLADGEYLDPNYLDLLPELERRHNKSRLTNKMRKIIREFFTHFRIVMDNVGIDAPRVGVPIIVPIDEAIAARSEPRPVGFDRIDDEILRQLNCTDSERKKFHKDKGKLYEVCANLSHWADQHSSAQQVRCVRGFPRTTNTYPMYIRRFNKDNSTLLVKHSIYFNSDL